MKIKDIGGEFSLIENLTQGFSKFHPNIHTGVGDDCAVIDLGEKYQLISSDTLVDQDHFNLNWSTPEQVGLKAVEVNVSDILACGGKPSSILVSLVLTPETEVELIQKIYQGIQSKCNQYQLDLIGGDTTHGKELVINLTVLGEVSKEHLRLRSHAQTNDLICVTGTLGESTAGLNFLRQHNNPHLLQTKYPYLYKRHLEPTARFDLLSQIRPFAHAMIDVSDGLASEVRHICEQSRCGAEVNFNQIPLHPETKLCAAELKQSAQTWALSGGEDFELVFTVSPENWEKIPENLKNKITIVGKTLENLAEIYLLKDNQKENLPGGYDHFKK